MAYSVNWATKLITIPTSDLTLVSGTRYQLQASDFLKEVRRLEASPVDGLWAEQILEHDNARVDFAGADYPPFDEIINGYTWTITGAAVRCDLKGSNNNLIDVYVNTNGCSVVPSNSLGLQLVSVGSGVTAQDKTEIIDGTAAKFNFNTQGDVLATLDDEQVNVKGTVSTSSGAGLTLQTGGVSKEVEKQLKAITKQLKGLGEIQPDERIDAIQRAVSDLSIDLTPALEAVEASSKRVEGRISEAAKDVSKQIKAIPQPTKELESITSRIDDVEDLVHQVNESIDGIEFPNIPQPPSVEHLATSEQINEVGSLVDVLQNFDDADLQERMDQLHDLQSNIMDQLQIIKQLQVSSNIDRDY